MVMVWEMHWSRVSGFWWKPPDGHNHKWILLIFLDLDLASTLYIFSGCYFSLFFLNLWRSNIGHKMALEKNSFDHPAQFQYLAFITLQHSAIRDEPQMFVSFLVVLGNIHIWISRRVTSRFFDRLNSMIYDIKRSVDPRWLFDPVVDSSLDDLVTIQSKS